MPAIRCIKPSRLLFLSLVSGLIMGVSACTPGPSEHKHTVFVFGTLIEITLYDIDEDTANQAFDKLESDFHRYHAQWTPWQDSHLRKTNASIAEGKSFPPPGSITPLITASKQLYERSQGLFNPAIGKLIRLWQMHRHDEPDIQPPAADAIDRLTGLAPSMDDLAIENGVLTSQNPAVELNFGAFAKGYAIDLALDDLQSQGIKHAVINAGGDLRVLGQRGDRAWRIGIRHPRQQGVIAWLEAQDNESVFSSGDYERYYMHEGRRYHHILDPTTGYPATGTASVTVIHQDAGEADAAATALFVAGPERWYATARSMGIKYVMLVDTEGRIHMNPAMRKRINLTNHESSPILLSQPL
jgi:thiamine biosynthesis lipoprotein